MIPELELEENQLTQVSNRKKGFHELIDVDNAYKITEKLAFPRLIGSEGEVNAIETVVDEFKKAGYGSINRQKFITSFHNFIYSRYIFLILGSGLILLGLSLYINPFLTLGLIGLALFLSFKALKTATSTKMKLSKNNNNNFKTENIWVDLKSKNSRSRVIFMGHWDSKSQSFPTSTRVMIFLTFTFSSLLLYLIFLIISLLKIIIKLNIPILNNLLLDFCLIIAVIGALNYFNKTGNMSPGAFDNAAAVGSIIELARYYKINPHNNIDITFLSPGSEELNLGGAIHYIGKIKEELRIDTTFFINLDFIGGSELIRLTSSYGIPRKSSSKKLNTLFLESAKENQIKMKEIYSPTGVWSDFMPIVQEGFEACWLGSQPGLKHVHTRRDNMDLVTKEGIKNILTLCIDVVKKLDLEYN
ncbi:MAG: M28 family metallopeptidase [Candidatus Hermodarchaeota archaeon]